MKAFLYSEKNKEHCRKIGWKKGVYVPWNTGLTKETDERLRKMSIDYIGKKMTLKARKKLSKSLKKAWKNKDSKLRSEGRAEKVGKSRKGKTYEEFYGKERAEKMKETLKKNSWWKKENAEKIRKKLMKSLDKYYSKGKLNRIYQKGVHNSPNTEFKKGDIRVKEIRARTIFPKQDTKPEKKVQGMLNDLKINFIPHKRISDITHAYNCDLFIPSMNLVIEADGNYWHDYPYGTSIDIQRNKEMWSKGYHVLRLWADEIKVMELNDFQNVLNKIKG